MSEVGKVCHWALKEYIDNQWRWPRESDLVVELVTELKKIVGNDFSTKKFDGKLVDKDGKDEEGICKNTLRIRTEVRLGIGESQRVDICLLNENPTLYYNKGYGRRNIELAIKPDDVHEILEVKLDPFRQLTWVKDLIKLHRINVKREKDKLPAIKLHLLAINNSIELGEELDQHQLRLKCKDFKWSLKNEPVINFESHKYIRKCTQKNKENIIETWNYKIHFTPSDFNKICLRDHGIYLWTFVVASNDERKIAPSPACWEVNIVNLHGVDKDGIEAPFSRIINGRETINSPAGISSHG